MVKRPSPSVTTVRTRSMRAGLEASTVTPGRTAPDASLTTPAMPLISCADPGCGEPSKTQPNVIAAMKPNDLRCTTAPLLLLVTRHRLAREKRLRSAEGVENWAQGSTASEDSLPDCVARSHDFTLSAACHMAQLEGLPQSHQ